ncbi:hypothetical protein Hanom_Chr07g00582521 [Helianthus anomalus]
MNEVMSGMGSQDDVVWEESDDANDSQVDVTDTRGCLFRQRSKSIPFKNPVDKDTLVWYVSFGSLRDMGGSLGVRGGLPHKACFFEGHGHGIF